jgi:ATP-dependent Clp protease ATP-binding subunit ClpB
MQRALNELMKKWNTIPSEERVLREEVDEDDIAKVLARWTGIPAQRMLSTEAERLMDLEDELKKTGGGTGESSRSGVSGNTTIEVGFGW